MHLRYGVAQLVIDCIAALWAELDVKRQALLRVWNETFGDGFRKKRQS